MSNQVSLYTIELILNEVDNALYNKSRVISNIQNDEVRHIIQEYSDYSVKNGIPTLGIAAAGVGIAGGMAAAGLGGAAVGGGIAAGGALIGAAGGGAAAGGAAAAAGIGGAAIAGAAGGAVIPIIGPIVGAGVGIMIGYLIGNRKSVKERQKRENLIHKVETLQNGQIEVLFKEVQVLQEKVQKKDEEIARLKYLLGVIAAFFGFTPSLA